MQDEMIAAEKYSGEDYENLVVKCMRKLGFRANRTGKNDKGIDIVAEGYVDGVLHKFYIQCKYWNNTVGMHAIQEVFAGCHYYGCDGTPVLFTNNRVTLEARLYAKALGVEIIADAENQEVREVIKTRTIKNPNSTGLLGIIEGCIARDGEHIRQSVQSHQKQPDTKEQLKLTIISDFDKATEYTKEAARLQQEASYMTQKALAIQKEALIRNLEYG